MNLENHIIDAVRAKRQVTMPTSGFDAKKDVILPAQLGHIAAHLPGVKA